MQWIFHHGMELAQKMRKQDTYYFIVENSNLASLLGYMHRYDEAL